MIVSTGIDIVEIEEMRRAIERGGERLLSRIFTPAEQEYCEAYAARFEHYAGRFAAKEAALKALGTGWAQGVAWKDVEVVNQESGAPLLRLINRAAQLAGELGVDRIHLTLTHSARSAVAQVIFERI